MKLQKLTRQFTLSMAAAGMVVIASIPVTAQTSQSPSGTVQPGPSAQPGGPVQPGSPIRPGGPSVQPSSPIQPGTSQPGTSQPGTSQPGITQPGAAGQPSNANPATGAQNTSGSHLSELLRQVSQTGSFTTLARAVEAAGLTNTLRSEGGSFTILAPTDDAFAALPQDKLQRLLQPENRALLQRLLAYHVIPGAVTSNQIQTGSLDTLGGGLAVRVTSDGIVINNASVVRPDIQAQNGVVHVVSQVLMPEELRQQILDL